MRAVRVEVIGPENAYDPTRNAYGHAKTMRNNFVATKRFLENE